jgi:short-subunit dehydrogenase
VTGYPFRSALVTGASSGIGEAFVRRLAADGVATVVVARREDRLQALAAELAGVEVLVADLATDDGVADVGARLVDVAHPIDLLVNNAGFGTSGNVAGLEPERLADEIRVNALALTTLTALAVRPMVARRRGWLLNVSSVAGFQAVPGFAVYSATKAYVTSFTEALHEELRGTGVQATVLCPGLTRTEFTDVSRNVIPEGERRDPWYPAAAWLTPEAVAAQGLRDVANGVVVSVPGMAYRAFVAGSALVPRGLRRRLAGQVRSSGR